MLKKLTKILYISIALTVIFAGRVFAYQFVMDSNGIKCLDEKGEYAHGWINQGGFVFWFDANGYMATGKQVLEGKEYIFNYGAAAYAPIGALISDAIVINEKNDCSLRYVEGHNVRFDNGQTIVLIHGLTGCIEDSITLAQHYIAYGFRVIVPELVAHGRSYETANVPQIIARSTIGIEEIINKYIDEKTPTVSIVGTSLGGMVGSCIAKDLKGKVEKLALLISTYDFSTLNDDLEYENDTNLERYESRDIARGLDYETKKAYLGHRNVKVIKPYTDFSLKKKEVIDTINDQIKNGIPYVNNEFDATNYYLNIPNDHVCIDTKVYDYINLYDDIVSRIIIRNYKGYSNYLYQTIDTKNKRIISESKISDLSNYSSFINNSIKKEFKEMCFYLDNDLYKVRLYKDGTKTINVNDKKYVDDEKQISKVCVKK